MTDVPWLTTSAQTELILTTKPGLTSEAASQAMADAEAAVELVRRARIAEDPRWIRFIERTVFVWIGLFCVAVFFVCRQLGLAFWYAMWIATTPAIVPGLLLVTGVTVLGRERRKKRGILPSDQRIAAEAGLNQAARWVREVDPEVAELAAGLLRADRSLERKVHDLVWRSGTCPLATGDLPAEALQALDKLDDLYERHVGEDD